ncbi:hypothetical protein X777_00764 [Ooceraea biroi]|uniref:Uncharacterized protein n=1 Tax=Ooceraea biroi TaxID=2015173 RepID=A0A026WRE7_OOCBI|nr:hypothetical protein X777_00764 [Ooceraea biroi]
MMRCTIPINERRAQANALSHAMGH